MDYLEIKKKYPILSKEQQTELIRKIKLNKDNKAIEMLILSNLSFILKIATKYKTKKFPIDELVSEGIDGCYKAIEKFNFDFQNCFITYLQFWVTNRILTYIKTNSEIVHIPRHLIRDKILKSIKDDGIEETIKKFKIEKKYLYKLIDFYNYSQLSLTDSFTEDAFSINSETIEDESSLIENIIKNEEKEQIISLINSIISNFDEMSKNIITDRWLIEKPIVYDELKIKYKMSRFRIKLIEKKALIKLRSILGEYYD